MAHKVWFQLVDARGNKLEYFDCVKLTEEKDLDDFTEAVKERCQPLLANTPAAALSVLENINDTEPLLKSLPIGNRGRNGEAPLLVRVADNSPIGSVSGSSAMLPPAEPLLDATLVESWDSERVGEIATSLQRLDTKRQRIGTDVDIDFIRSTMDEVTLWCAVYGEGMSFPITVARDAMVSALQEGIYLKKRYEQQYEGRSSFDASALTLFLARKKDGTWLKDDRETRRFLKQGVVDTTFPKVRGSWKLSKKGLFERNFQPGDEEIQILVALPRGPAHDVSATLPTAQALLDADTYTKECESLDSWAIGEVHSIPAIASFFNDLGGCTEKGKLLWRQEEQDVASIVLGGWLGLPGMDDIGKKKTILVGSPGVGKSTLLCLLAFYAVFKLKKNVLVYRQLGNEGDENCLIYVGYDNGQVVYSTKKNCRHANVKRIYDALIDQHTADNFWLFLDGFEYLQIPIGLGGFRMLATSHEVDLRPSEETYLYCILHPSWKKDDLVELAHDVYGWEDAEADERFYYSGGSVQEFVRPSVADIATTIERAVKYVDVDELLSWRKIVGNARGQVERLRHTFLKDKTVDSVDESPISCLYRHLSYWKRVIDSEYAIVLLSDRMRIRTVEALFKWTRAAGPSYGSLSTQLFKILIHLLAKGKLLVLHTAPYTNGVPDQVYKPLKVEQKEALRLGTQQTFTSMLNAWKDDDKYSYWYPDDSKFPNIDAVIKWTRDKIKVEADGDADAQSVAATGKANKVRVAYLQMTVSKQHSIDAKKLKDVNDVFDPATGERSSATNCQRGYSSGSDSKAKPKAEKAREKRKAKRKGKALAATEAEAAKAEKPMYVLLCPTREECNEVILEPQAEVSKALKFYDVRVGYYERLWSSFRY